MAFYQFRREQKLGASVEQIWDYISSPMNLKEITPVQMGFEVTSEMDSKKMYPGMIISYKVSPLPGYKTNWVTEITQVRDQQYFVDEQRVGPYKIWHHQHLIEPIENGVLMKDIITYSPPFGVLGAIANSMVIKKKLNEIFEYRKNVLEKKFGTI